MHIPKKPPRNKKPDFVPPAGGTVSGNFSNGISVAANSSVSPFVSTAEEVDRLKKKVEELEFLVNKLVEEFMPEYTV